MEKNNAITFERQANAIEKAVNALSPLNATDITSAKAIIHASQAVRGRMELYGYKTLEKVNRLALWKDDKHIGKKGTIEGYGSFTEWAKENFGIEKAQAFNAVKCGQLITDDGTATIIPKCGSNMEYTFTALVKFVESKTIMHTEGKGVKTVRDFEICHEWKRVCDKDGKPIYKEVDGAPVKVYEKVLDENGNPREIPYLFMLAEFGVISPEMSIKELTKAISQKYVFTEYGAIGEKELNAETETDIEPETVSETETDIETEKDVKPDKYEKAREGVALMLEIVGDLLKCLDVIPTETAKKIADFNENYADIIATTL